MMPHIHFFLSIIIDNLLKQLFVSNQNIFGFILGSIFPDFDLIFSIVTKKNHRLFFTHYPVMWVFLTLLSVIIYPIIFWFLLGASFHMLIDVIDWEIYFLMPFSKYSFSILHLNFEKIFERKTIISFLINYYRNSKIIIIEAVSFILFLLTIFQ